MAFSKLGAIAVALGAMVAVSGEKAFAQQDLTIKVATVNPDVPQAEVLGIKTFKSFVESRSGGKIRVRTFFQTLGGERELTEQVKQGSLEIALVADGAFGGFYKQIQAFTIPYLFNSSPAVWRFFQSPVADNMREDIRKNTGIRVLTFAENGFRNFTNNVREIKTPADVRGMKIRTMESQAYMKLVEALGATPTPISGAESVLALRQGVVDGQENATGVIADGGTADVQKFLSVNEHVLGVHLLITNDAWYSGLDPETKRIIADGAALYATFTNARKMATHSDSIEKIRSKGLKVHFTTAAEKAEFRKVVQEPVRQFIEEQVGKDLVKQIVEAAEAANATTAGQ
jgi:TRAP-type transport system periplasmic protein